MKILAACDIGNSTTEACVARAADGGRLTFLASASVFTTGMKGAPENVTGAVNALEAALAQAGLTFADTDLLCLNEAAPVVGGSAMETVTQTRVAEASMLGHNPKTPAGAGVAAGRTCSAARLSGARGEEPLIAVIPASFSYEQAAELLNGTPARVAGAILERDEAVLVYNRLREKIPVVDEVRRVDLIPEGVPAALEVAEAGRGVRMLSNPYGIATLLRLTPEETAEAVPIARSLTGARSGAVFRANLSPRAEAGRVKAGRLTVTVRKDAGSRELCVPDENAGAGAGMACLNVLPDMDGVPGKPGAQADTGEERRQCALDVGEGAEVLMERLNALPDIEDAEGEPGTQVGAMFAAVRESARTLAADGLARVRDVFAADTLAPMPIRGASAGETALERAVAIAAMVSAGRLPMERIAAALSERTGVFAKVSGVEAVMAALGAFTTPGAALPLCVLDLGGGSTDAALLLGSGEVRSVSLAGAGEMVTMLIQKELALPDRLTAENIKKYPAVFCESLFHYRLENGETVFTPQMIAPRFFGRAALLTPGGLGFIDTELPAERIALARREAKRKVFAANALRALKKLTGGDLRAVPSMVLVGGSAEDFEIPEMIAEALTPYGIVCGRGNIRGLEGARNAVATGLLIGYEAWA